MHTSSYCHSWCDRHATDAQRARYRIFSALNTASAYILGAGVALILVFLVLAFVGVGSTLLGWQGLNDISAQMLPLTVLGSMILIIVGGIAYMWSERCLGDC